MLIGRGVVRCHQAKMFVLSTGFPHGSLSSFNPLVLEFQPRHAQAQREREREREREIIKEIRLPM